MSISPAIVIFIFWLIAAFIFANLYNKLIKSKNQVDYAFSTIDVLLQKRWDLIPNLVAIAEKYMQFEQKTLTEIVRLRTKLISERVSDNTRVRIEDQISRNLDHLIVTVEAYPELKTNEHFIRLQYSLTEIEEQISAARRFYNSAVTEYNNTVEMFPTNLFASWMNYQLKMQFQISSQDKQSVNVRNLFS
ncbi:LemA family protein [Nostoc sp. FACHB-87]|uniref:LemA family protein n=1 Tax=Nostocales TaxID=1161 RepID=UPI001683C41F|nr:MULTISPECIES: LemA family protein [Nostocales]MBD2299156.1 LemA family protein [Nostoc sp. FACHB-190]MBD2454570.1 LemA family protein [Nostoc sp. FACHB-87]MBD2476385.1 LemA family protein [Anabaena sp. FACHB-83]MBD2488328.1 LemA family protein [Aulosira sp. FACHB-615]